MFRIPKAMTMAVALVAFGLCASAEPIITTASGKVAGSETDGIQRFFGIPYAAAPAGPLRWRAPEPVKPWGDVRQATAFGPVCRQTVNWIKEPQSEDCLRLNIWAPAKKAAKPYPVMVWIHGGGFFGGSGSQWGPDGGNSIVRNGVILVTLNYRLGVLGFFAHPELSAESPSKGSGNQGILDQIAALKWIQSNIAVFGGDPSRVTVVGESAGGGSVALLTMSPAAKGLFHRAIAESGTANALPPKADAEKQGADFAQAQGAAHLADLCKLDVDKLLQQTWHPQPNNDGAALPVDMAVSYTNGQHNRVPIITGWNSDEGQDLAPEFFGTKQISMALYDAALKKVFGPNVPAMILQAYPGRTDAEAQASAMRLSTDMMGFSAYLWGTQQASSKTEPAYLYHFVHWPAEPATPCGYGCKAGHGAEIRFAFDQLALDPRPWNSDDKHLADQMVRYWTNFAKTGNPNGEGLPEWKAFDGTSATVQRLGSAAEIRERGAFPDFRAFLSLGR